MSAPGPKDRVSEESGLFRRGSSGRGEREIPPSALAESATSFKLPTNPNRQTVSHGDLNHLSFLRTFSGRTLENSFNSSNEFCGIEGFGDIFIPADVQSFELVFFRSPHGQHDNWKMFI